MSKIPIRTNDPRDVYSNTPKVIIN